MMIITVKWKCRHFWCGKGFHFAGAVSLVSPTRAESSMMRYVSPQKGCIFCSSWPKRGFPAFLRGAAGTRCHIQACSNLFWCSRTRRAQEEPCPSSPGTGRAQLSSSPAPWYNQPLQQKPLHFSCIKIKAQKDVISVD